MSEESKPFFNSRIFWDVAISAADYGRKASFIIERVFERGDVEDIRRCRRYYGDQVIKPILLNARSLSRPRIFLASAVLHEPLNEFRCYTSKQSNPGLSPY